MKKNPGLTCQEATYLVSKKQEDSISLQDEQELKQHLEECKSCRLFEKQTDKLVALLQEEKAASVPAKLRVEVREKIRSKLGE